MPRLPRGLVKKRGCFFSRVRRTVNGRRVETTIALGPDENVARARHRREQRRKEEWSDQPHVEEFAAQWLADYVSTMRSGKGPALAKQRVTDYVLPVIGRLLVA